MHRAQSCRRVLAAGHYVVRAAPFSLVNGFDDNAQSWLQPANVIDGRRDATHSNTTPFGGLGQNAQVLAVAVGAAGELGVHRRKVGPFTGTDESSTVLSQGFARTAGIADGGRTARSSKRLPHIRNARGSAAATGISIQNSVPRTEGTSSSAHGFAHADAGGGDSDGVRGLALPPAGDTGTEDSKQLAGDGGGHDAISTTRSLTIPCAGGSITDSTAQSAVNSGGRHNTAHGSAPLCDRFVMDMAVSCRCAHVQLLMVSQKGVIGAGQCGSYYSAQSLVSQSGIASNSTTNATTLSLVGGHASSLQGSHAAQAEAGHDGTMQPKGRCSGSAKGAELYRLGGCSALLLDAVSNAVQDLHTGALPEQQAISSHPPFRPGCCVGTLSSSLSSVGGENIGSDDTAASVGTSHGDLLLQQRLRAALQHQRPQLSNEATCTA
ncbi:hypothetical protein JKP88DRAFT_241658 [Tribonema minus]|uniref:Uncharacterized protein n=1 Tax=Tribonema minus TaxID=303371 RepID=A0A836CD92_9STRA|nr:hypothetical protein JKP88DRAFT_241658 [Tribonema minus]